eukprot:8152220-Alexandrium_andersonii.AAC.1
MSRGNVRCRGAQPELRCQAAERIPSSRMIWAIFPRGAGEAKAGALGGGVLWSVVRTSSCCFA